MLCTELGGLGFTVVPISNGQEALVRLNQPETKVPDFILTDLQMPFADGRAVLKAARAKWPEIPVVLLTATHDLERHGDDGFSEILPKPVSLTLLRQSVARLLGLQATGQNPEVDDLRPVMVYPDQKYLDEALLLIRLGAISDLVDWATALAENHPQWSTFAECAKALADRGNLKDLADLCEAA
jgi:CheY-like chemotaxis protein